MIAVDSEGLRDGNDPAFVQYVLMRSPTRKVTTPFICIIQKGPRVEVKAVYYLRDLFQLPDKTVVLHAWVGQWRTDVFHTTVGALRVAAAQPPMVG